MIRRVVTFVSAVSLSLFLATAVVWVRSRDRSGSVEFWTSRGLWELAVRDGRVWLDNEPQRRLDQAPTAALNARFRLLKTQLQAAFGQMASEDAAVSKPAYAKSMDLLHGMQDVGLALQKWNGRVAQFAGWSVPCFGVLAATSIAPGAWVAVMIARRRALKRGCCRTCGYDLIGNASGVCPECGTIIGLNEATTKVASNTKG